MFKKIAGKLVAVIPVGVGVLAAAPSFATGGPDFSSILTGLDASSVETTVIAAGAILALVGFCIWASKRAGKFFG